MKQKGTALIIVLGLVVITSIFMASLLSLSGIQVRTAKLFTERLESRYLAQAGIETAISRIAGGNTSGSHSGMLGEHGEYQVEWIQEDNPGDIFTIQAKGTVKGINGEKARRDIEVKLRKRGADMLIASWREK